MYLDEDSPGAFALFVNWLYRSIIEPGHSRSYLHKLADLYIFLDKICLTPLKDTVMDIIQDMALKFKLDDTILFPVLEKMARCAAPYKGLTKFCLYAVVDSFVENHGREIEDRTRVSVRKEDTEMMWKLCQENFDLFHSYMLRIEFLVAAGLKSENYWNPRARKEASKANRCFFHCHEDAWDCRAKQLLAEEAEFVNVGEDSNNSESRGQEKSKFYFQSLIFSYGTNSRMKTQLIRLWQRARKRRPRRDYLAITHE